MTETELIQACLREDRLAQKALYERYNQAMFTLAYRITGDFDLANDVLQEGFIKVFQHLVNFRKESTLGAWIKTIVLRTALSKVKRQQNFAPEEDIPADYAVDWGDFIEAEYLEQAINNLPPGYRTVFILIEVEGYSHQEVADLLGISTGTSKSQLFYAKKRLREALSKML
ncbi:MAG: RNA polymerase sigma factor [Haliscomenobacter sp.]|nr:RNA polymerase sigma factor [Haliscomenobacter sp.]MBK7474766.1 RNA polymerase sigma factor [Haliscomenobacter sp.]MBK8877587.1 RNA polymerase sigma factor [Haliscomenobacter sp.]